MIIKEILQKKAVLPCNHDSYDIVEEEHDYNLDMVVVKCKKCGQMWKYSEYIEHDETIEIDDPPYTLVKPVWKGEWEKVVSYGK